MTTAITGKQETFKKSLETFADKLIWVFYRDTFDYVFSDLNLTKEQLRDDVFKLFLVISASFLDCGVKKCFITKELASEFAKVFMPEENDEPSKPEYKEDVEELMKRVIDIMWEYGDRMKEMEDKELPLQRILEIIFEMSGFLK